MSELDNILQNTQSSFSNSQLSQRLTNNGSATDLIGAVPPPPAYPGSSSNSNNNNNALSVSSGGGLRTKISLGGRKPAVIMPFVLMKPELAVPSPINGNMNLLTYYGLDHAWNKFCAPNRKLKVELSAFLPHLPGNIDMPGNQDNSSLRSLIDKPPICGKEIMPLSTSALSGFKLQPGPIPETYRVFAGALPPSRAVSSGMADGADEKGGGGRQSRKKHKRKHERSSHHDEDRPIVGVGGGGMSREEKPSSYNLGSTATLTSTASTISAGGGTETAGPADWTAPASATTAGSTTSNVGGAGGEGEWKKSKTEESGGGGGGGGASEKKKKKKKDKKRKRSRSPDHASSSASQVTSNPPASSNYAGFVDF